MEKSTMIRATLVALAFSVSPSLGEAETIEACYHGISGQLRVVTSAEDCRTPEKPISWNELGPAGPQGEPGPAGPQGDPGPAGPSGPAGADAVSPTFAPSCPEEVAHLKICQGTTCHELSWPCAPYKCNDAGTSCGDKCVSNADCALGAECDTSTGRCGSWATTCSDDFTVLNTSGQTQSCSPYRCIGGGCQQQCETITDCAEGYACTDGRCVETP